MRAVCGQLSALGAGDAHAGVDRAVVASGRREDERHGGLHSERFAAGPARGARLGSRNMGEWA
jgi:hypothetical protein